MPTLWIHAFNDAKETAFDTPNQKLSVSVGGASASAAALTGTMGMQRVRLMTDTDCHVAWSAAGTAADTTDLPMGAENPEYFGIPTGYIISCIQRV